MSFSMLIGRVLLPVIGLLVAVVLTWQTVRNTPNQAAGENEPTQSRPASPWVAAEGRVVAYPGAEVVVSAEVLGTITDMPAREGTVVKKGDLLAAFRDDDIRASLREARARLAEAEADVAYYAQEGLHPDRTLPVPTTKGLQGAGYRRDVAASRARRDTARAAVERLEAAAARYRVVAPIDGTVITRYADAGETLSPGAPVVTVADLGRLRIEAQVDEFDIPRVVAGAAVRVSAEGYGSLRWDGEVEEVSDVVVARQTRPEDPSRPSDTRVLPVKIRLRESTPLKLGQRVDVQILMPAHGAESSERP